MSFKDIKAEAEDMDATQELSDESMDKNYVNCLLCLGDTTRFFSNF